MNSKTLYIILGIVIAVVVIIVIFVSKGKQYNADTNQTQNGSSLAQYDREELTIQKAQVDEVSVVIMESFPVQVRVTAKGNLRNGCEEIYEVLQQKTDQTFRVLLNAAVPKDAVCTQVVRPFEETFSLDVLGLSAGTYTVDVNGVLVTFVLTSDNLLDYESSQNK